MGGVDGFAGIHADRSDQAGEHLLLSRPHNTVTRKKKREQRQGQRNEKQQTGKSEAINKRAPA